MPLNRISTTTIGRETQMSAIKYDLVVIGSGPAGQRAAVAAAKIGKRVAVVEARSVVGGLFIKMVADKESLAHWDSGRH